MGVSRDPYLILFNFWEKFGGSVYLKPALIGGGILFFVILLALVRKHIFKISMRGAVFGFVLGLVVMILLDLIIVIGMADKNKVKKLTAQEDRREAVQEIFISGISGLGNVLGVSTAPVPKVKKNKSVEEVIGDYLSLPPGEADKFKNLLCPP